MKPFEARVHSLLGAVLSLLVLFICAPSTTAQWDAITHDPANPVTVDGFIIVHVNASGVNAFSAVSRKWMTVSPPGSPIVGIGDWTMLTQESGSTFRGYSARRNASALLTVANPVMALVHDDVALVIESGPAGPMAHGYSAVRNSWDSVPLLTLPTPAEVAISRFVIAIRDKNFYHGFAARTGAWNSLSLVDQGDLPAADGNTVLVDLFDPSSGAGLPNMAAFSGVRGIWAISPDYASTPAPLLDHNVASVRVRTLALGMVSVSAFTAYDAAWITSPVTHVPGGFVETISDNIVRVADASPAIAQEAFGARPATWATLGGNVAVILQDEDYVIARLTSDLRLFGFSGVCGGAWIPESTPAGVLCVPVGAPDHMISLLEGPVLHSFLPATNSWSAPIPTPAGTVITGEDALTDVRVVGVFRGNATRWGTWTTGPPVPAAPFGITSGGSVIAHQQLAGVGAGDIYVFDERCDMWVPPFNPGVPSALTAGRNLLVTDPGAAPGAPVYGYSVQRGDWTTPGPIVTPLALPPVADENVAWLVDGTNRLWGFGSPNTGHVYYAWPNGTEYHVSGALPGTTLAPFLGYSIHGTPGVTGAYGLLSAAKIAPVPLLPYLGLVCIDLSWFANLGFFGVTDPDCIRQKLRMIPLPLPTCVQFWLQPLSFNFGSGLYTWEHRCDPAWFF